MSENEIVPAGSGAIVAAGKVANHYAKEGVFAEYLRLKSDNTLRAQLADLAAWSEYLCDATAGADCPDAETLQTDPSAWRGVVFGLVKGFREWMLRKGFAVGTVNRRLSTVKVYCGLACQAGVLDSIELALVQSIHGFSNKDAKRVDERRDQTRTGAKKATNVSITYEQAQALKTQPDTPQGRRDAVVMALLLDHGLRVGELVLLQVQDFDLNEGKFKFYRPKVDKVQTHQLTADSARVVSAWLATDAPAMGPLLRGSRKGGELTGPGMTEGSVNVRVRVLGKAAGLEGLSPHDCRHYWATRAANQGTDAFALRDAGGWNSLSMPSRYVEAAVIANARVKL